MSLLNKRVFIIEDNLSNRAIAQMLLEHAGATVVFERWGTQVLDVLKKNDPIDIILLDLMFPRGVSGFDVFKKIKADPDYADTPIVAVSAADASTAIPHAQELGFSGFIAKPIDFKNFADQIEQILNGVSLWYTPSQL